MLPRTSLQCLDLTPHPAADDGGPGAANYFYGKIDDSVSRNAPDMIGLRVHSIGTTNVKTEQRSTKASGEKQGSREKILEVATELFLEHGYAGTPLSAIAAQLDFTKAALYYHFKSKVDILSGILSPLLDAVDGLLEQAPERFPDAQQRWEFLYNYSQVLLSHSRAVAVLGISSSNIWLPQEIKERIDYHRRRTMELAMLPEMSDEEQVKAILLMDVLHREIVFTEDRMVVPGMTPERRREIVYGFIREALDGAAATR